MAYRLRVGDCADIQQKRALDSHETHRREHGIEPLYGIAGDVLRAAEVVSDVVAGGLHVVDLERIQRVQPMLTLADEIERPPSAAYTRRAVQVGCVLPACRRRTRRRARSRTQD